jgi:hypothetical protein
MEPRLDAAEVACVKRLAELYDAGRFDNGATDQNNPACNLGVPWDKWETVLRTMERVGVIDSAMHGAGAPFLTFRITPNAVQLARQIREEEQAKIPARNIVEEIKERAKSSPVLAWIILAFVGLAAFVAFVNQLLELLKKLGIVRLP